MRAHAPGRLLGELCAGGDVAAAALGESLERTCLRSMKLNHLRAIGFVLKSCPVSTRFDRDVCCAEQALSLQWKPSQRLRRARYVRRADS